MFRVVVNFITFEHVCLYAGQFLTSPPCGLPHRPHVWGCPFFFSLPFHGCCFGLLVYLFVWTGFTDVSPSLFVCLWD